MRGFLFQLMVFVVAGSLCIARPQSKASKPESKAPTAADGAQAKIKQAVSAAPLGIAKDAAVMDWPASPGGAMRQLRAGKNGWTCMPSTPTTFGPAAGQDPMCVDHNFMGWAEAWMSKKDPQVKSAGVAYMLKGDKGASNTDPFATGPTADNQWVVSPPHVMIVIPNPAQLEGMPTDPNNGGPWVMWKGTKYAHIMVPVASGK